MLYFLTRFISAMLDFSSMVLYIMLFAAFSMAVAINPSLLEELITAMVYTPIVQQLWWFILFLIICYGLNRVWKPLRFIIVKVMRW